MADRDRGSSGLTGLVTGSRRSLVRVTQCVDRTQA